MHAADLWFTYRVRNTGTEYARDITDLAFNVYLGDSEAPIYTYFVAPDVGGDGGFHNFMPGQSNQYVSQRIPLTLEQMKALDLGAKLRIVAEDFTYGLDEFFYADAAASGVMLAIEDGTADGTEEIERYLVPTSIGPNGEYEKALDVLARYFPHTTDDLGQLNAIWTPEYRSDTPSWCDQPKVTGLGSQRTVWCRHALSVADWWNIYTDGLGDGSQGMQDSPAVPGALALFRFNKDSDLDGYSDRSEQRLGTNTKGATSYPRPELLAGVSCDEGTAPRTCTLSLLNTGVYDAYGVEAVMVSPDATTTITNNTVGGSGRVKAGQQVVVGSHIRLAEPLPSPWTQPGHARPAVGGYYTGNVDRTITFTVVCPLSGGCIVGQGTWGLTWTDGTGTSSGEPISLGAGYASPKMLDAVHGMQVGLQSGRAFNGESFGVTATTPRDTFQFSMTGPAATTPVVIVSYNDPQGNHRFVVPPGAMDLSSPNDNLAGFGGRMLEDPGIEIVTAEEFSPGPNVTTLLANNPSPVTLSGAQAHLVFVDLEGNPVLEVTEATELTPGPNFVDISWNTSGFSPAFDPGSDYLVMAFLTDSEGNILDAGGRPLSSFQSDPVAEQDAGNLAWDFGTVPRGTLISKTFSLGSVGARELLAYVDSGSAPAGLSVSGPSPSSLGPGDVGKYTVFIDTSELAEEPFNAVLPIRTSDIDGAALSITVTGEIEGEIAGGGPGAPGAALHPLDVSVVIPGDRSEGDSWLFSHTLGPDGENLHPISVYDEGYAELKGYGALAPLVDGAFVSTDNLFGSSQSDIVVSTTTDLNSIRASVSATAGATALTLSNPTGGSFAVGDLVLLHQTRGGAAGTWETGRVTTASPGSLTLADPLQHTYASDGGANRAQVVRVPEYRNVMVEVSGSIVASPWNGNHGGIVAFIASGTTTVNGSIQATGVGFVGGTPSAASAPGFGIHGKQGEGTIGPSGAQLLTANGSGGGGGKGNEGGDGGGGGGNGTSGASGDTRHVSGNGGAGGGQGGSEDLGFAVFGGGGGSGGGEGNANTGASGGGGAGGGFVLIQSRFLTVGGTIAADGTKGGDAGKQEEGSGGGGGGAGAGGSVLLKVQSGTVGSNQIHASGGAKGLKGNPTGGAGDGGAGGIGRIRIEHCDAFTGATSPAASTLDLDCYIVKQTGPTAGLLTIPDSFTGGATYQVQYGRILTPGPSGQLTTLRVPAGQWSDASFHALISNAGAGSVTMTVDIGNDSVAECTFTGVVDAGVDHTCDGAALYGAFNDWWSLHGGSGNIDVPVRVVLNPSGQVILTDLQMVPSESEENHVRLDPGTYASAALTLDVGESGPGAVSIGVDVGADGDIDWQQSFGSVVFPLHVTTGDIAAGINEFTASAVGPVDVPVLLYLSPALGAKLAGFTATPANKPDLRHSGSLSVTPSPAQEGQVLTVSANIANGGAVADGVGVSFFATAPFFGRTYIGSDFLQSVDGGGAVASIQWDTVGFYGSVTVEAVVDAYNRTAESNESNNSSSTVVTIVSRPDLEVRELTTEFPSGLVSGEVGGLKVAVKNNGQGNVPGGATLRLYDGDPATTGTLIGETPMPAFAGSQEKSVVVPWSPVGAHGIHNIHAIVDFVETVVESNEGNNRRTFSLPVGMLTPVAIDSGGAGDVAYSASPGTGFVDPEEDDLVGNCGTSVNQTFRLDPSGAVTYQFDNLVPARAYHIDITMFECGLGAGRIQGVTADGSELASGIDLGDGEIHRLSVLLDPTVYADQNVLVSVMAGDSLGALVNAITIREVDYRYADAGSAGDTSFALSGGSKRFGWLDGAALTQWGTLPYQSARADLLDNEVRYQFDGLVATKNYDSHLTFFVKGTSNGRLQSVLVDGALVASGISVAPDQRVEVDVAIPVHTYQDDGSIVVAVRTNGISGAVINEIVLEERTLAQTNAAKLNFVQQPVTGHVAHLFVPDVVVAVQDASGTTVTTDNSTVVTLTARRDGADANLICGSAISATVQGGVARFQDCWVSEEGTYTLHAAGGLLAEAVSSVIEITGVKRHHLSAISDGDEVTIYARNPAADLWYRERIDDTWGPWSLVATGNNLASRPVAVRRPDGDTFVFYRGREDNDLQYVRRSPGGDWDTVRTLYGVIDRSPEAAVDANGDIVVVIQPPPNAGTPGNGLYYQTLNAGSATFSGWIPLDGIVDSQHTLIEHEGDIYLAALDLGGGLLVRKWNAATHTWEGWVNLGGVLAGDLTGTSFDGTLYIVGLTPGNVMFYRHLDGGGWGPWVHLGGWLAPGPSAVATEDGIKILATSPPGHLWTHDSADGSTFTGWELLGGLLGTGPEAVAANDHIFAFALSPAGLLFYREWDGTTWGPWENLAGVLSTD